MQRRNGTYRFVMEIHRGTEAETGSQLVTEPIVVNWRPALECARFALSRRSRSSTLVLDDDEYREEMIEPDWHTVFGSPYIGAVRAIVQLPGQPPRGLQIPLSYFGEHALAIGSQLQQSGQLTEGEHFAYRVCAYHSQQSPAARPAPFSVESATEPVALVERPLAVLRCRGTDYGLVSEEDIPVFVPQRVIREAVALTREAGAAETGGILIGRLYRDSAGPEIFAEVTAQIPARYARQELTSLTFTPETWVDVNAALQLRDGSEIYLGWWHSHPARQWCRECPVENRKKCKLSGEFFSAHDAALHRCVFPRAYSLALVISDSYAAGLTWPLFGWRNGMIVPRGFHVLDGQP